MRIVGREVALRCAAGGSGTALVAALFKGIVFDVGGGSEGLSPSLWKCGLLRLGLAPRRDVGGVGGFGECAGDDAKCLGPVTFQLLKFAVCIALFASGDMES